MTDFGDAPLIGSGSELQLTIDDRAVVHENVIAQGDSSPLPRPAAAPAGGGDERNLYAVGELLAARAASPATRRQYRSIYRAFGDWLRGELGRPPVVGDLDADVVAAWARHLELGGGRSGGPAAPATRRIYLSMVRALARETGREDVAAAVKVPRHRAGPPETLSDTDYANLLRVPDRRTAYGALSPLLHETGDALGVIRAQDGEQL